MQELNGFLIETYNLHGFAENAKESTCPLCSSSRKKKNDKCLSLNWNTGLGKCWHCGEIIQMHSYRKKEQVKEYKKPEFKNKTKLSDNLVKWFDGRKISQRTLTAMQITEGSEWMPQTSKEENTIHFNYFRDSELVNVKYRDGRKNFKLFKDAEKIFYNLDNIRTEKECIIVEGEIDCLSFFEAGYHNCVSVPNGFTEGTINMDYLDNCYDWFENKDKIYICVDNDKPGLNGQKELIRRLGAERCFLVDLKDCKDSNDYIIKYGAASLRIQLESAQICPIENVETLEDHKDQLRDFYINGAKRGYGIGIEEFDSKFTTNLGQYITITGVPTHGKSNFVDQMCVGYSFENKWKIAYASPENKPFYLHSDSICQRIYGDRPKSKEQVEHEKWTVVEDYVSDNFMFIDFNAYCLRSVLDKARELVKRRGIKVLVIDPFNKVRLKESVNKNINEYTIDYLNEIEQFARTNDILIILVAHPVKPGKNEKLTYIPGFYDIKGGGEFADMSPHGLCIHRNFSDKYSTVHVMKCKFRNLGENGAAIEFAWNVYNGRYTPIDSDIFIEFGTVDWDNSNFLYKEAGNPNEYTETSTEIFQEIAETNKDPGDLPF